MIPNTLLDRHPGTRVGYPTRLIHALFSPHRPMKFNKKLFLQRAFLAFTTGLFLACAARVSAGA